MRRLADGGVIHVEIAADRAHDDLTGVEPHADLHVETLASPKLLGVAAHRLVHPEGGVTSAYRVIFVSDRRPEQCHDPITHHLVDGAFIPMNRLHHPFEHRVEELARLLGVAIGQQLHRALQVGEEDRDLLALAFEGGLGSEDLLGEVLGSVGLGRGELHRRRGRRRRGYWLAAFLAKLRAKVVGRATAGARHLQPRPALLAKHGISRVLVLTPGTLHRGPPDSRGAEVETVEGD